MSIRFDRETNLFHLQTRTTSYVMSLMEGQYLNHLYWGKKLRSPGLSDLLILKDVAFSPNLADNRGVSLDTIPQEYPAYGAGDFREPAYQAELQNGTKITELIYVSHTIQKGKPGLEGLPAVYVENDSEADTLVIVLEDKLAGLQAELSYTVLEELD
ncbi:MAG: alpha-galactosidase, partial [Paenibacillaceae bacterium]|nr:alpha-galactosidase [Paenibacillaceae bacterium]